MRRHAWANLTFYVSRFIGFIDSPTDVGHSHATRNTHHASRITSYATPFTPRRFSFCVSPFFPNNPGAHDAPISRTAPPGPQRRPEEVRPHRYGYDSLFGAQTRYR